MNSLSSLALSVFLLFPTFGQDPKPTEKEPKTALGEELQTRVAKDQAVRFQVIELFKKPGVGANGKKTPAEIKEIEEMNKKIRDIDEENTRWLKSIVEKEGWPSNSKVGKKAASAAWLLLQHADQDPKFQRKCLDLMNQLPPGEVQLNNLALLTDRVLLAEGKKQLYGSQFESKDGKWVPRPIEDEAKVDERRKKMGLQPLAEYAKALEELYGAAKK